MSPSSLRFLIAAAAIVISGSAQADIVFLNQIVDVNGQGFGNAPRLITVQAQGNNSVESGSIGVVNGALAAVAGISNNLVFQGNGVTNAGGDEVNPVTAGNKFNIPTLSSLNWTSGANVELLFNATEPGGNGLTINDVTLKFYNGNTVIA